MGAMIENLWLMVAILYILFVMYMNLMFVGCSMLYKRGSLELEPLIKAIGNVTYTVTSHFKQDTKVTAKDKLIRLMEKEVAKTTGEKLKPIV